MIYWRSSWGCSSVWESACMACKRSRVRSPSAPPFAEVAELVYALVSKTSSLTAVRVQLPSSALFQPPVGNLKMNFLRPTKLTFALFSLPFLLLVTPLLMGKFIGVYDFPFPLLDKLTLLLFLISTLPLFYICKKLGIDVGRYTDWFGFPEPNLLGWALIILINGAFYYLAASAISRVIKSDQKRNTIFYTASLIGVVYISLSLFYSINTAKKNAPIDRCSHECLTPANAIYNACTSRCDLSFPADQFLEKHNSCIMNECANEENNFVRQCNAQCLGAKLHAKPQNALPDGKTPAAKIN